MALRKTDIFDAKSFDHSLATADVPLTCFRDALKFGRKRLQEHYLQQSARAEVLVHTQAWLVDQLLTRTWRHHLPLLPKDIEISLIAVGGYGRGELHPASDIDLMLLLEKNKQSDIRRFVEVLVRFLWDMGLEVGHSVRSLKDCVRESKQDITVVTNLMEARLLYGDKELLEKMQTATGPAKLWPNQKFFAAKWEEQIRRHHRYDDTAYNLEPNIKEGPGGLRDIQMISWVTQRHFGTRSLHDLVQQEFLTEEEYRTLIRGRNYLWHVRNGLHYVAERREDRLLIDHQRALATQHGFKEKPGSLAVEQFMKRYYRTVKELSLLNEISLQHFQEAILTAGKTRTKSLNRRFQIHGDFIETKNGKVFEHTPYAMLEMFLIMEQNPSIKGVRAHTIRQLRANLQHIDQDFRGDIACRSLFMEILRERRGITHELRRMNAYGVLGAYLPAFGRIVGQMQHDLFHVYTVDEHSLFVLRNVRRFTVPEFRHEFPLASAISQHLVKPERLYVAALFHDIAKGRGGDHSELGEREVRNFCTVHDLSEYDTLFICWLVRHHLLMSMIAQRQDIHDPDVVLRFAQDIGDQEHLDNLYLLTVADIRGTSPKVWNPWKGRLLTQLYSETTRHLRRGFGKPIDLEEHITDLQNEALDVLKSKHVTGKQVRKFWEQMDNDYFLRHTAEDLAWHARVVVSAMMTDLSLVSSRYDPDVGGSELLVYTPDRKGLFSVMTGAIDRMSLSIVDARMHGTRNGYVLDTFVVLDTEGNAITQKPALAEIERVLQEDLLQNQQGRARRAPRLSRQMKHFPVQAQVLFSPSVSGQHTIIEVRAQDRPGLLHQIALALHHCHVRLVGAKVATYGERAEDIFFVTDREGRPITDTDQLAILEKEICDRLAG